MLASLELYLVVKHFGATLISTLVQDHQSNSFPPTPQLVYFCKVHFKMQHLYSETSHALETSNFMIIREQKQK